MDDPIAFLAARLDEDEEAARTAELRADSRWVREIAAKRAILA